MNKRPLLVACDVYRPAAINQIEVLGEQVGVEVYKEVENKNPVEIAKNAVKHAKTNGHNVVIKITAGLPFTSISECVLPINSASSSFIIFVRS